MQNIDFIKMHGLGNDFVIIDRRNNNVEISKEFINKLSDRKSGAGAFPFRGAPLTLDQVDGVEKLMRNCHGEDFDHQKERISRAPLSIIFSIILFIFYKLFDYYI